MAFAQPPAAPAKPAPGFQHPFMGGEAMHERWMQQLNLSPAQQQQAKTIFGEARESSKPLREELRQNRDNLEAAMKAGDTAKMHQLSMEQGTLMGKMIESRTQAMSKFYAILTPEQRVKSDQMRQQMRERMRQRMEQRRPS